MKDKLNRVACISVADNEFAELINEGLKSKVFDCRELPADAVLISTHYDHSFRRTLLYFVSEEFDVVMHGRAVPVLNKIRSSTIMN